MKKNGAAFVMYDAPGQFDSRIQSPYYDEVGRRGGATRARRYEVLEGPESFRKYIALFESDDVDAMLAWLRSSEGQRAQENVVKQGETHRHHMLCKPIYRDACERPSSTDERGAVVVMYDAPAAIDTWIHGPHYEEVKRTPGVTSIFRYEVIGGPLGCRKYVALIETDNIQATVAWRSSPEGQRSQAEANARGVTNRYGMICKRLY